MSLDFADRSIGVTAKTSEWAGWLRGSGAQPFLTSCCQRFDARLAACDSPILRSLVHDQELIGRVLAGDPGAERELYDAHVDRVFRLVYRIAGDLDRAQDYTQETFIRAFARLGQFRGEAALSTWIGSIAVSIALNGLRKVRRLTSREVDLDDALMTGRTAAGADPDLKDRLARAIDDLPEGYRMVFVMHDVEGYTHEEIAGTLGVHPGTSKAQLFRARARLREALADFAKD
jgi:RNA polymerase sigma-70 factor (ECF subfamily)